MSRYIDVDALGIGKANPDVFIRDEYARGWNLAIEIIENAPTADVVEVVRCKDCKYRGAMLSVPKGVFYTCKKYLLPYCKPDDYCSYGERMDGETSEN